MKTRVEYSIDGKKVYFLSPENEEDVKKMREMDVSTNNSFGDWKLKIGKSLSNVMLVLNKAFGKKNIAHLVKKKITNKLGEQQTVYVNPNTGKPVEQSSKHDDEQFGEKHGADVSKEDYAKMSLQQKVDSVKYAEIKQHLRESLQHISKNKEDDSSFEAYSNVSFQDENVSTRTATAITKNMQKELKKYTNYLAGETVDLCRDFIEAASEALHMKDMQKYKSEDINKLMVDCVQKLVYQERMSNRNQFGDHGIRHIVANIEKQKHMLDLAEMSTGMKFSGIDRLMAIFIMINHDMGYTATHAREGGEKAIIATKDHPAYSVKMLTEQKDDWDRGKIFDADQYNRIMHIVATHDSAELETTDMIALTTRISDNIALFDKDKLPSAFKYVKGSMHVLHKMANFAKENDEKNFNAARDELYELINQSDLGARMKRDLKMACMNISQMTPKFTVGMLAGEISSIRTTNDALFEITIKHNKYDAFLQDKFEMGQRQVKKLLEAYGITNTEDTEYKLGEHEGKAVLKLKIENAPVKSRQTDKFYLKSLSVHARDFSKLHPERITGKDGVTRTLYVKNENGEAETMNKNYSDTELKNALSDFTLYRHERKTKRSELMRDAAEVFHSALIELNNNSFKKMLKKDSAFGQVYKHNGKIVGAIACYKSNPNELYVAYLAAHPEHVEGEKKIKGIGSTLLHTAMYHAYKNNCDVTLSSYPNSVPFYQAMGFEKVDEFDHMKITHERLKEMFEDGKFERSMKVEENAKELLKKMIELEEKHGAVMAAKKKK